MKIKGDRQCLDCGTKWSYFDTRTIECPECGSIKSRSVSEGGSGFEDAEGNEGKRKMDTQSAKADELEFSDIFSDLSSDRTFDEALKEVEDRCRSYVSRYGFVRGGELQPPEPSYIMACEAMEIADVLRRATDEVIPDERHYIIDLVKGIDAGTPPEPDERPESLDQYHNLAVARTVDEYASEVTRYARRNGFDIPDEIEEAREKAKRTKATEGKENDAVEGLRLLRDAYEKLSPV